MKVRRPLARVPSRQGMTHTHPQRFPNFQSFGAVDFLRYANSGAEKGVSTQVLGVNPRDKIPLLQRVDHAVRPLPLLHPTPSTTQPAPHTLYPAPHTLHPATCTAYPAPHTLHPTPCTPHPAPHTLHPTPCIPNPKPLTLKPQPQILSPEL